jgi:hypothetical protein
LIRLTAAAILVTVISLEVIGFANCGFLQTAVIFSTETPKPLAMILVPSAPIPNPYQFAFFLVR